MGIAGLPALIRSIEKDEFCGSFPSPTDKIYITIDESIINCPDENNLIWDFIATLEYSDYCEFLDLFQEYNKKKLESFSKNESVIANSFADLVSTFESSLKDKYTSLYTKFTEKQNKLETNEVL